MGLIYGKVVFECPACKEHVCMEKRHFNEWECMGCHRIWGIEVSKPVFELGGVGYVGGRKD